MKIRPFLLLPVFTGLLAAPAFAALPSGDRLIQAAQDGQADAIAAMLARHVDVNATDGVGATALSWAVLRNDLPITARLLAAHADANHADVSGEGPLTVAIRNNAPEAVKLLLDHGADPNLARKDGETPLMTAVHLDETDIVAALLAHKADVNVRETRFGQTALMWAAGHPAIARMLLDHGADTRPVTKSWAVTSVIYTPQTATLGSTGIPWNNDGTYTARRGGLNALLFAIQADDIETARMLLDAGMDVNGASADGTTPLLASLYNWQVTNTPVDPRRQQPGGLRFTADIALANLLLDRGARIDGVNAEGYTPLHGLMVSLVPARARRANGRDPAPAAPPVRDDAVALAKRLLDMGANPNRGTLYPTPGPVGNVRINPASPGSTPLHLAADLSDSRIADLMFAHGANPNQTRKDGHTPFTVAVMSNSPAMVEDMLAHGADVHMLYNPGDKLPDPKLPVAEVRKGQSILHIAAAASADKVIALLVSKGAPGNVKNDHGETALQAADNREMYIYRSQFEQIPPPKVPKPRPTETSDAIKLALGIKATVAASN